MKRIRIHFVLLFGWLLVLYGLQRLLEPIGMHPLVFPFACVLAVVYLVVPNMERVSFWIPAGVGSLVFLGMIAIIGAIINMAIIPITILEIGFLILTIFFTKRVKQGLHEFEKAILDLSIGRGEKVPEHLVEGHGSLYREIRRARNHQRPLTLLAIGINEKTIQPALNKLMQEAQLALMKQVILSSISKILCEKLEDCDIIVQDHDHFLVALPETTPEDVPGLINRLYREAETTMGVELNIGTASLPCDGYTLEGLIDKAARDMSVNEYGQAVYEFENFRVKEHIH